MKPVSFLALGALALCLTGPASAEPAAADDAALLATAKQLTEAAKTDEVGLQFVEDLTTEVGQRLAGSPAEQRARDWAVSELKSLGFTNIRVDSFEIPYWARKHEHLTVLGPHTQDMVIAALGGSRPTPEGGLEAEVVRFGTLADLQAATDTDVAGKIVFIDEPMYKTQDGSGYGLAVQKRGNCHTVAAAKGAVACLIRSVGTDHHRQPHAGAQSGLTAPDGHHVPMGELPAAALSPPDADQLTRLLARGPVTVNLDIAVDTAESAPSGNVIAEIEGGAHKDEIVLLGCHLDSWDLGTGAIDDAAGCGIAVGAAKLIDALPGTPDRTIRVVLFGSEEPGLFGGDAYTRQHAEEAGKHVLAAESDFGADRIWKFQTRFGEGAMDYAKAMQSVLVPLGVVPGDNEAHGSSDIGGLRDAGVPVVTPYQDGRDYFDYHHTPDDTFDKIDPEAFRQNVAVYAAFAYLAAESGWDFRKGAGSGE